MLDQLTLLSMLEVTVPPDTPLTIHSEVKILEIVGVVSNPDFIKSLNLVEAMVAPTAPATLHGLVKLLSGLGKMNPNTPKEKCDQLDTLLQNLQKTSDVELTFGIFLPIVRSIVSTSTRRRPVQKGASKPARGKSATKRRSQAAAA